MKKVMALFSSFILAVAPATYADSPDAYPEYAGFHVPIYKAAIEFAGGKTSEQFKVMCDFDNVMRYGQPGLVFCSAVSASIAGGDYDKTAEFDVARYMHPLDKVDMLCDAKCIDSF